MSRKISYLACLGLASSFALSAHAQVAVDTAGSPQRPVEASDEASEGQASDVIIVTARKRAELLQDVPAAITAFSTADIERYGLDSVDDLARLTPGLQSAEAAVSSGGSISLRGVGSGSTNYLGDQAVSINVDGMQVGTLNIRKTAQIDMAQIEVLRGPQALFFGKNSPGGVLSLTTADPGRATEVELSAGVETVSQDAFVQGIYSAPLSDEVGLRLVARYSDLNGYFNVKSVAPNGDPLVIPPHVDAWPKGEEWFFRGSLVADPMDNLKVRAKLSYNKSEIEGGSITAIQRVKCPNGTPQLQPAFPCLADRDVYRGGAPAIAATLVPGSPTTNGLGLRSNEQVLSTLQVDYEFAPDITATSVTGYYRFEELNSHNASIGPRAILMVPYLPFEMDQVTQEFRVVSDWDAPLNFTIGAFYESREAEGAQDAVILLGPSPIVVGTERTLQDQSAYSAFGQLLWNISDALELSVGARYSHEEKDLKFFYRNVDVTGNLARDSLSFNNLSPEVTLKYDLSDEVMMFASYKEGFKSGGFDAGFTNGAAGRAAPRSFSNTFDEENVTGFEGGMKGTWPGLDLGLTAYSYEYTDLQVGAFDAPSISFKVLNAAAATIEGVEFEGQWQTPLEGLSLRGSLAYNQATFDEFLSGCYVGQTPALGCNLTLNSTTGAYLEQDMAGKQINNAPEIVGFGGALYSLDLDNGMGLDFNFDVEYSDSYFANLRQSPDDLQESFTKLNAGVTLYGEDDRWELALEARNLTDEYTFFASGPVTLTGSGSGTPTSRVADTNAAVSRGREIFLRLAYRL
jgi:iron complex outermembrane receptor protein